MPPRKRQNIEQQPDPFAPAGEVDGADEAQTELPPFEIKTTTSQKEVRMSEGKFVGTIKGGRDFDEPWIVMHCDTLVELVENLTNKELLGQAMDAAQAASEQFRKLRRASETSTAQNTSQNRSQPRTEGRPAAVTEGPWGVQTCPHGTMIFKSGQGDDGSTWQGYFCPVPKGQSPRCAKNKYVK
jgi:hypothetical protein